MYELCLHLLQVNYHKLHSSVKLPGTIASIPSDKRSPSLPQKPQAFTLSASDAKPQSQSESWTAKRIGQLLASSVITALGVAFIVFTGIRAGLQDNECSRIMTAPVW